MCVAVIVILAALAITIPSYAQTNGYENGNGYKNPCNFCRGIALKWQTPAPIGNVTTSHSGGSPGVTTTQTTVHGKQAMFTGTYTHTYTHTPKIFTFGRHRFIIPILSYYDIDFDCGFATNYQYQEWSGNGMTVKQAQVAWSFAKARSFARQSWPYFNRRSSSSSHSSSHSWQSPRPR